MKVGEAAAAGRPAVVMRLKAPTSSCSTSSTKHKQALEKHAVEWGNRKKASVGVALDDGVAKATRGTKRGTKAKGTAAAEAPRRQSKRRRS